MDKDPALNIYDLSRAWFDFCFANPELVKPNHTAVYFFAIEHCNRLGWKKKFGLPTSMVKEAIGIKSYVAYSKALSDLVEWGFIVMVERSKNQYSSNIIALSKNVKALDKALDKALVKHTSKHCESTVQSTSQSTSQSTDSIDKQFTNTQIHQFTNTQSTGKKFDLILPFGSEQFLRLWNLWVEYRIEAKKPYHTFSNQQAALQKLTELAGGDEQQAISIIKDCMANNAINFYKNGKKTDNSSISDTASLGADAFDRLKQLRGQNNGAGN